MMLIFMLEELSMKAFLSGLLPRVLPPEVDFKLESWFIGNLEAVAEAYARPDLANLQNKAKYREPDRLGSPSRELVALVPEYGKVDGARRLGPRLPLDDSLSPSFNYFIRKVKALTATG